MVSADFDKISKNCKTPSQTGKFFEGKESACYVFSSSAPGPQAQTRGLTRQVDAGIVSCILASLCLPEL